MKKSRVRKNIRKKTSRKFNKSKRRTNRPRKSNNKRKRKTKKPTKRRKSNIIKGGSLKNKKNMNIHVELEELKQLQELIKNSNFHKYLKNDLELIRDLTNQNENIDEKQKEKIKFLNDSFKNKEIFDAYIRYNKKEVSELILNSIYTKISSLINDLNIKDEFIIRELENIKQTILEKINKEEELLNDIDENINTIIYRIQNILNDIKMKDIKKRVLELEKKILSKNINYINLTRQLEELENPNPIADTTLYKKKIFEVFKTIKVLVKSSKREREKINYSANIIKIDANFNYLKTLISNIMSKINP